MIKHVSLSANDNPIYLFYLPLTCWAWNKFGWRPIISLIKEQHPSKNEPLFDLVKKHSRHQILSQIDANESGLIYNGYKTETVAQLSRLYAAVFINDGDYLMTGDCDLIPLSDYWKSIFTEFPSFYGWDLTEYQHMPICFIGMSRKCWLQTMEIDNDYNGREGSLHFIQRDLNKLPNAKSQDKTKRWVVDQDFITEKINYHWPLDKFKHLTDNPRGVYKNGYPIGRVDRSAWSHPHNVYIDCHAPHDILTNEESRHKLFSLLKFIWPNEDFTWWIQYQKEFLELLKTLPQ